MEKHMGKVIKLLKTYSYDSLLIVIVYGMAGVENSSLEKVVHNHIYHKFEASCYVYNVPHKFQYTNGIR